MTGTYPHQNGVTQTPSPLDPAIPTVAMPFNDAGYHTAYVGKWHLDGSNARENCVPPERRGNFQYWMGYENNNNQNECYVYGSESETPQRLDGYETDSLTTLFLDHLADHVGGEEDYQPFFAVLSVQPPHSPFVPPTNPERGAPRIHPVGYSASSQCAKCSPNPRAGSLGSCGLLRDGGEIWIIMWGREFAWRLKDMGVDRETYVIFFSDHGDMLWSHAQTGKSSPWEESVRIPFIIGKVGGWC